MRSTSQPLVVALAEGKTLAGKYRLVRRLGEGGMCVVYETEHIGLGQALALKVLKPELADDPDYIARFEREARAAAQLRSPHVAKVFDVDYLPSGQPYITMELLVGHDLGDELDARGRLPVELAIDYVRQACTGIAEAHALGIVHRDLKPENLFLTELGELTDRKLLKIFDFGIAKTISDDAHRLTAPDAVFGTVDYMSPEQIRSASKVDHRTDLWSLGVILYELLTGRTPYKGDARSVIAQIVSDPIPPPTTLAPELPASLVGIVMKMLHKNPDERFQSAEDFRAALIGYSDIEPITSVIARLPPQSVPRRSVLSAAHGASSADGAREARTHGSWETKDATRSRGRSWFAMPLIVMALGGAAGFFYWRGQGLPWLAKALAPLTGSLTKAEATEIVPSAAPAASLAVSPTPPATLTVPASASSSASAPLPSTSLAVPDVPDPGDAPSPVASAKPVKARPRGASSSHPAGGSPPPMSPSVTPPTMSPAPPSRLPKHS